MGLFNHNKKKDVIVGPSGYAYTNEEDSEGDHRRRTSTSSSNPRRSVDQPRTSTDSSRKRDSAVGVGAAAGTALAASGGGTGRKSLDQTADVNRSDVGKVGAGNHDTFTSGVLPQSAPTEASSGARREQDPNVAVPNSVGENAKRERIFETAKAPHAHPGREKDSVMSVEDAKSAEHDHKYLQPVVHERIHRHHVEEIETHRTVARHVHHIQHHIQPIIDEQHTEEVHLFREVPVTTIKENHAMSDEDRALFERLNIGAGTTTIIPHDKVVVNKGETMRTEHIIHHVHHIVQPIWQRDLHEYFRLNPPTKAQPAPYSTTYTGPGSLGTAYYPEASNSAPAAQAANPASIYVQHGRAPSVGGSVPNVASGAQVKEGYKLVPIGGTRHEVHYVNREPVQSVATGRTEVFPTHHERPATSALPQTSKAPYQTAPSPTSSIGHAGPTAAAGHTLEAERGMRNLSLGVAQ